MLFWFTGMLSLILSIEFEKLPLQRCTHAVIVSASKTIFLLIFTVISLFSRLMGIRTLSYSRLSFSSFCGFSQNSRFSSVKSLRFFVHYFKKQEEVQKPSTVFTPLRILFARLCIIMEVFVTKYHPLPLEYTV